MPKIIPVLYRDEHYVAFDKPSGLLTIPTAKKETHTLVDLVNEPQVLEGRTLGPQARLHPCHRLDRETSGVVLFARGKKNQQRMMELFRLRRLAKVYIAFVRGRISQREGTIDKPVADIFRREFLRKGKYPSGRTAGQSAVTRFRVLAATDAFSVIAASPLTGRTNQIRIHFQQIGHPLLGERVYAYRRDFTLDFRRLALHAFSLAWPDPETGARIAVQSPLPSDMARFLAEQHVTGISFDKIQVETWH